jgi:drug/metabolite transporter, DME family
MHDNHTPQLRGFGLVAIAAILWGTIGIATQGIYNVDSTSSLFINFARLAVASPILLIMSWRVLGRSFWQVRPRDAWLMVVSGVLLSASHAFYFAAIRDAGVTIATLLTICLAPLVISFLSAVLKLERLTRRTLITLACALLGSVLLVGVGTPDAVYPNLAVGVAFSLLAALTYGSVVVCGRFLAADSHPLQVTTIMFCAGTLALGVVNLVSGVETVQTTQGWLLVLYLGVVPSALAYWLFQVGLRFIPATAASIVSMLDPLVAALLAWALFGEMLSLTGVLGAILLLASILVLAIRR